MPKYIFVILILSLGLNIYFLLGINKNTATTMPSKQSSDFNKQTLSASKKSGGNALSSASTENINKANKVSNTDNAEQQALLRASYEAPQDVSKEKLFTLLTGLQSKQQYEELTLPLQAYLRLYPDDYKAWLIEADLILHTAPLNTAIAFYYGLLEKNLPAHELTNVKNIIQVNTNRVIQQFSADAAWDLLATFIEPLLQIEPLNPRYILALAKAYGKQEQLILMENVLAALPFDDQRAMRLRETLTAPEPSELKADLSENIDETSGFNKRKVAVIGNGEQFLVRTNFYNDSHLLLIDTGASTSAISQRIFMRIPSSDKEFVGRFTVQTAGGSVQAPLFKLAEVEVGQITMNNVSVIVLPEENFTGSFQGLLGMNVLRNFELRFDPEKQKMTLFER